MKKNLTALLVVMVMALTAGGAFAAEWAPRRPVQFLISSTAGGSSDMFVRTITGIANEEGFVTETFVIVNNADGGGQIVRYETQDTNDPDHTLLCMSSGDMSSMLTNTDLRLDSFVPVGILAADKHLIFGGKDGKYPTIEAVIEAAKAGTVITIGSTQSDELTAFQMFVAELGLESSFTYVPFGSSADSLVGVLGNHVDLCMGKPAAAREYVIAGTILPLVALASERFTAPFDKAPTMQELGYDLVEFPVWRGVVASKNMSPEALKFWNDTFRKVTENQRWTDDYLNRFLLAPNFMDIEQSKVQMEKTHQEILDVMAAASK